MILPNSNPVSNSECEISRFFPYLSLIAFTSYAIDIWLGTTSYCFHIVCNKYLILAISTTAGVFVVWNTTTKVKASISILIKMKGVLILSRPHRLLVVPSPLAIKLFWVLMVCRHHVSLDKPEIQKDSREINLPKKTAERFKIQNCEICKLYRRSP